MISREKLQHWIRYNRWKNTQNTYLALLSGAIKCTLHIGKWNLVLFLTIRIWKFGHWLKQWKLKLPDDAISSNKFPNLFRKLKIFMKSCSSVYPFFFFFLFYPSSFFLETELWGFFVKFGSFRAINGKSDGAWLTPKKCLLLISWNIFIWYLWFFVWNQRPMDTREYYMLVFTENSCFPRSTPRNCENMPLLLSLKNSLRFWFWIFLILYMMVED